MHLMLLGLDIKRGDEIITPSMTFASTLNMITLCGAKPVFVDIHYDTLNINADLIEEKITKRTRGIIPVHFAGAPVDMDKILGIAKKYDLFVIEDAAHALARIIRVSTSEDLVIVPSSPFIRLKTSRPVRGA